MRSSFFGYNVALSGLYSAQKHLDVVNHNVNNALTPGYSRQQVYQSASRPIALYDGTGMMGTGSQVNSVKRVRDEYLDFKYWSERTTQGEWDKKAEIFAEMEITFNEPSDSGFTKVMGEFFDGYQELSKDASNPSLRTLFRQRASTLAKYFNNTATQFERLQDSTNDQVKLTVEEINSLTGQIQQLNKQIYTFEIDGNNANDLRDARTLLVDKLSGLIDIQASEVSYGKLPNGKDDIHFLITVGGKALVDHYNVSKLALSQREDKLNAEDVGKLYSVGWEDGNKLNFSGGTLKGLIDLRDGNDGQTALDGKTKSPLSKGIPYYQKKLNEFVQTFALAFNEGYVNNNGVLEKKSGHVDGFGLSQNNQASSHGKRFFSMLGEGGKPMYGDAFINNAKSKDDILKQYKNVTAKNFSISGDIEEDINKIATSDKDKENGNTNILNQLIKLRSNRGMFYEGAPEDYIKSLVGSMGIDSQQAKRMEKNQDSFVKQIDGRRMSVSQVEMNEEMTNIVKFQQAYNAAAKMISTMSEIYETLINRLGV